MSAFWLLAVAVAAAAASVGATDMITIAPPAQTGLVSSRARRAASSWACLPLPMGNGPHMRLQAIDARANHPALT